MYILCIYIYTYYVYVYIYTYEYESRSKCLKTTLVLQEFFCQRCAQKTVNVKRKGITWDHTRQSIQLGVNQAHTVVHIHRTGKNNDGNSTCGALFPAVSISFGIQLACALSLSLSLLFLWQISFEQYHILERLFSDNNSDNLAITICCTRSPGQAIEPFP